MEIVKMKILRKIRSIQENMGVVDRSLRMIAGSALIIPLVVTMMKISPILMEGQPYALVLSFYLLVTGMTGRDPIYLMFHGRTCGLSERNRCGSFMYQMKAALGRHPGPDQAYEAHALKPYERVVGVNYAGCWI
jgi:hypothetical protein